jgi:hypothetical protein
LSVVSVVRRRSLRRADHSSRGVLPTVVRSRNLMNEEALFNWGLSRQKQTVERKTFNRTNRTRDFPYQVAADVIRAHPSDLRQKEGYSCRPTRRPKHQESNTNPQ